MANVWELKSVLSPIMDRTLVKLQLNLHRQQPLLGAPHEMLKDELPRRLVQYVFMSGHVKIANNGHAWATESACAFDYACWDGIDFQQ